MDHATGPDSAAVLLHAGPDDTVEPLLARYAPRIVVFPEVLDRDAPPWPARTHDYHPRPVDLFLDLCHTVELKSHQLGDADTELELDKLNPDRAQLARAMLSTGFFSPSTPDRLMRFTAYVGLPFEIDYVARPVGVLMIALAIWALATGGEVMTVIGGALMGVLMIGSGPLTRRWSNSSRIGSEAIRDRLKATWPMRLSRECMTWTGRVDGRFAWSLYRAILNHRGSKYPRTVYGRMVPAGDLIAVQYWLFFFFNHWRNVHEGDWELVTVLHDPRTDAPQSVGISSHEGGLLRVSKDVAWPDGSPLVYCAVGSHALYFQPKAEGYLPSIDISAHLPVVRTKVSAGSSRDWVPNVPLRETSDLPREVYQLVAMPSVADVKPENPEWNAWWWLAYGGAWGRITAIDGPANQKLKWEDPIGWAKGLDIDYPHTS